MKKSLIVAVIASLFAFVQFAAAEAKTMKLKSGEEVVVDGENVTVGGKAAPDGTHELEDGSKLTVKEGKVVAN
jgi:hypothetical protein